MCTGGFRSDCYVADGEEEKSDCVVRPSATVSRIGLMESRLRRRCHWVAGPSPPPLLGYPPKAECDEVAQVYVIIVMEDCPPLAG